MAAKINFNQLLSLKQPKVGKVLFIAVDGHGGSGKSSLAELLSARLGAQIIRTDDFASWDNLLNWWPLVIERIFKPIQRGDLTLNYPRSKWWENHYPEPVIEQLVTPVMILEGVSSMRKEFREYISLGFFVDTPKALCLERGVFRDAGTGKPKGELEQIWNKWFDEEDAYMQRDNPKVYADIVLDGTKPFEEQLE